MPSSPRPPWIGEDGRYQSHVGYDAWTHCPPADEARLVGWLAELDEYRRGARRPGGVAQAADDRGRLIRRQVVAAESAARRRALEASRAPVAPPVLESAQAPPSSDPEEIDVERAAAMLHVTEERVRQLVRAGRIRGRKADRNVWVLVRADVIAEVERRSGRGTGGSEGPAAA